MGKYILEIEDVPSLLEEGLAFFKCLDAPWWRISDRIINRLKPYEAPQWIPVTDRLPEDDEEVIVSCTDDSGDSKFTYTTVGWHYKGLWVVNNDRCFFVVAWMPLPEPYKED